MSNWYVSKFYFYSSVKVIGRNPRSMWWNTQVKAAVMRREVAWREVLGCRHEEAKEKCLELYKEEKRKVR